MNAIVSQDVCIGCGLCTSTVDEVFRMNDDGKAEDTILFQKKQRMLYRRQ